MQILLLGHSGYLGSYLKEHLQCDILEQREVRSNGNRTLFFLKTLLELAKCILSSKEQ